MPVNLHPLWGTSSNPPLIQRATPDWLNANISPVYKKGDAHLPGNYRPVSLTCVSCKILEHIIRKHILDHLDRNKILTTLNHGFRSGYSCETQLVMTVHDLGKFDRGSQINMIILDFSKAFDTVPHRKLKSTTSTMSYRRDLLKTTLSPFGVM